MNNLNFFIKLIFKPLDVGMEFSDFIRSMYFPNFRSITLTSKTQIKKKIKKCVIPSSFDLHNVITSIKKVDPKFTKIIVLTTSKSVSSLPSTSDTISSTTIIKSILTNKKVPNISISNYTLMPMTIGAI